MTTPTLRQYLACLSPATFGALVFSFLSVPLSAQQAPSTDPTTLAKYDKNKNGRLDQDEIAAMEADQKKDVPATGDAKPNEVVNLSPFEVSTDTKGYYSSNSMSGTRINSKIEDLGASITVVTKEQMSDFAMLDINDIFLYTASTEGTGTYTDFTVDRNGSYSDNVELNPQGANRVRGIGPANVSMGNFETMGRTPVDPLAIDGVEVSRGPNANVFGLGSPAGTVNQVPATANASRDRTQVQLRGDSYDGYRTSLDLNRVLIPNKLAIRASGAFQHDGYTRKPSGTNTARYNGMVKFQPFKTTTISLSTEYYRLNGNRPNAAPPRDNITYWLNSGAATWDPVTQQVHLKGNTVGTYPSAVGLPDYFLNTFTGSTRGQIFVDQNGLGYWTTPTSTAGTTPIGASQPDRLLTSAGAAGVALGHITAQPLFTTTPSVSSKSIYDWSSINTSAINRIMDRSLTTNFSVDQVLINSERQSLAVQGAFFREDTQRYARNLIGTANQNGQSGQLEMDVNERLLDGTPNPYFLRPFIGTDEPATVWQPYKWDTYRAQVAYKLDLTHEPTLLKWLGMHQFSAYDEYKYRIQRQYRFRDVIADTHAWVPSANLKVGYYHYYVGDNKGSNIDYAPTNFKYGSYPLTYGDSTTGVFFHEPTLLSQAAQTDQGGGGSNSKTILKTVGAVLQSHFVDDRVVTTFGIREDRTYVKFGNTVGLLNPDGLTYNYPAINSWAAADWRNNSGKTKTGGVVLKPFREMHFIGSMDGSGSAGHFAANLLNGLSLSYNKSDSFTPQTPAQDLFLRPLPNATGQGQDYGVNFSLFDNRIVIRAKHYLDKSLNARNGDANTIAQRVVRMDVSINSTTQLRSAATTWVTTLNPTWTTDQISAEVAKEIGLSLPLQAALDAQSPPLAATNDVISKGNEIEINYNPTKFWTVAGSVTETESITSNVSATVQQWIDLRMPIWSTIKDPTIDPAVDPQQLWWNHNYGGSQTPAQNFSTFVQAPYAVIRAQEGKPKPEIRKYNARVSTNFRLAGISDNQILKGIAISGAVRWEDKGGLGYLGVQQLPAVITALDANKPVYDSAHTYLDAGISYRTRVWGDRIGASFQLNVRNIQESGHLQATAVFPDGTASSYRIVDPRQFILTATFDL